MDDPLRAVLIRVQNGEQTFRPENDSIEALREFQPVVKCLKEAKAQALIDQLTMPSPSKGIETSGLISVAIVRGGLTYRGIQFLSTRPSSRIRNWLSEHGTEVFVGVLSTIIATAILAMFS